MPLNRDQEVETPAPLKHISIAENSVKHLLESPEALDAYLMDIRRRREAHREQRRRAYWMDAIESLGGELDAAEQDRDTIIAAELRAVIHTFQDALAAPGSGEVSPAVSDTNPIPTAVSNAPFPTVSEQEPLKAPVSLQDPALPEDTPFVEVIQKRDSEPESSPSARGEADENGEQHLRLEDTRQALEERVEHLEATVATHLETRGKGLSDALRTRSLFCQGQALLDHPITLFQERQPLTDLLADLTAGTPWANRSLFCCTMLSSQSWGELAELYDACVVAAEAMDWYDANEKHLPEQARVDLLNTVAAAQRCLYRRPESVVRRDDTIQELYRWVREAGERTAFIRALSPHIGDEELPALACRCALIFHELRTEVEEQKAQAERAIRKEAAVDAVLGWEEGLEGRGVTSHSLSADRQRLCALLDECMAAGVPATNVKVRTAILDTAPVLLDGETRYAKFLDAVLMERSRRKLDAVEVAEAHAEVGDEDLDALVGSVLEFTRGKRVIMLGGKSRPQVSQELARRLECDVTWSDSDRGDKFSKFASSVKKADAVLLLKNFASHEIFYGSKDAMSADDKHFVVLPSGYGVKQVVYQLSQYIGKEKGQA